MKKFIIILLVIMLIPFPVTASENEALENILSDIDLSGIWEYTDTKEFYELYGYTDPVKFISDIILKRNDDLIDLSFFDAVKGIFRSGITESMNIVLSLFAAGIMGVFVKSLSTGYLSDALKNSVNMIMGLTMAVITGSVFFNSSADCVRMTKDVTNILGIICPAMLILMASGGLTVTAGAVRSVLMLAIGYGEFIINNLLIPLSMGMFVLSILDSVSDGVNMKSLVNILKKSSTVFLGISFTVISGIISIAGLTFSGADNIGLKAVKYAAGSLIPVVGSFLGGSVDTVLSLFGAVKGGVGLVGVMVIISVMIFPVVRLFVVYAAMKIISAVISIFTTDTSADIIDKGASSLGFLITLNVSVLSMSIILIFLLISIKTGAV